MGAAQSTERKRRPVAVDLLPPRFAPAKAAPLDNVPLSPWVYLFGADFRHRLFNSYFAPLGSVGFSGSLRPDSHSDSTITVRSDLAAGTFDLGAALADTSRRPAWQVQGRVAGDGSMRGSAAVYDAEQGIGAFATVPFEYLAIRKDGVHAAAGRGSTPSSAAAAVTHLPTNTYAQLGHGVGGPRKPNGLLQAAGGVESTAVLPEAGVRWHNAQQTVAVGAHVAPFHPYPLQLWSVAAVADDVQLGVQVKTDMARARSAHDMADKVDVDLAASVNVTPMYQLSFIRDAARNEAIVGFNSTFTTRRRVWNPLERADVKGIYQLLDFGVEVRRHMLPPFNSTIALAGALQLNRSVLLKARASTTDAAATVAMRNMSDPQITLAATVGWQRGASEPRVGLFVSLDKGTRPEYNKPILGMQEAAPYSALAARPELNQRISSEVDMQPLVQVPGVGAGRPAVSLPANRFL